MKTEIHIIHDRSNVERSRFLNATIAVFGISPVIWPAVPGNIAEAHKQIVRYAKEQKLKEILIAEDDVFFYGIHALEHYLANKPKTFDLYLGGVYTHKPELPCEGNIVRMFSGLHLYTVHQRFYDLFLGMDTTKNSLDNALSQSAIKGFGKYVVCYPYAAVQRETLPSTSPVSPGVFYKHKYFFNTNNTYGYEQNN